MTATEEMQATAAPALTAYHWVITLQGYGRDGGVVSTTTDGTANLPGGFRRKDAFPAIVREAQRMIRERPDNYFAGDPVVTLFFSLEPDVLP
jgi:hypothetical protein